MNSTLIRRIVTGLAFGLLVVVIVLAWNRGKARARARFILQNAEQMTQALQYFYSDQGRYPTSVEFSSDSAMGIYLNPFPSISVPSKNCTESFAYENPTARTYALYVCLPRGVDGFVAGVNKFSTHE